MGVEVGELPSTWPAVLVWRLPLPPRRTEHHSQAGGPGGWEGPGWDLHGQPPTDICTSRNMCSSP